MKDDLTGYDALALGDLVRKGEIKPTELLEITIQRIEQLNPKLNAVIHKLYDQAGKVARDLTSKATEGGISTPFYGVPFLLKDLVAECEGTPFHEGSFAVKGYVSKSDSELVKRQKSGGLVIVGKTNTPEFGLLPYTEPALYGPTVNPWDPGLTPGGSSGGSAAAVAAGIVPMAHGNDGGGSIRIPAACCGIFGLKPTRGRNPLGPLFGDMASGIAIEHALTRTVRDSAALLDITSGPDLGDPYWAPPKERPFLEETTREAGRLKIGLLTKIPPGWFEEPQIHPDCESAVKDAALLCQDLGHIVEEVDHVKLGHSGIGRTFSTMFNNFTGHCLAYWERELSKKITEDQVEPLTWTTYQACLKKTGADYLLAVEDLQLFSRKLAHWYHDGHYDLLMSPTMPLPPQKIGAFQLTPENPMKGIRLIRTVIAFTFVFNATGQPAMSMPLFWNKDNIPIGVQFAGRFGDEACLFRLAAQLEKSRPWTTRKPAIRATV